MMAGVFVLLLGGFAALALAMPRHHEALFGGEPGARRQRRLRGLALRLLVASLACVGQANAPALALVQAGVLASAAALLVAAVLTWWPPARRRPAVVPKKQNRNKNQSHL